MDTKQLYELFDRKYLNEVKPFIEKNIPRDEFSEPIYYILDNFKLRRFRAAFPLIFAETYKINKEKVLPIAAVSELIFTTALVQDDIIDGDRKRGDIPAAHIKFGKEICIASSDYMHAQITKILWSLKKQDIPKEILLKIFDSFVDAHTRLYKSFIREKLDAGKFNLSKEKILETFKDKTIQGTNSLFCSSLICTEDEKIAELIREYSYDLAIAGQIKNDVYDATSYLENRGYSDLKNGYITYVIQKLLESIPNDKRSYLEEKIMEKHDEEIITFLKLNSIIKSCMEDCSRYVESAISRIKGHFPPNLENILIAWAEGNRKFSRKI